MVYLIISKYQYQSDNRVAKYSSRFLCSSFLDHIPLEIHSENTLLKSLNFFPSNYAINSIHSWIHLFFVFRDLLFALFFNYVKHKHESKSKTMQQDTFSFLASPCLGNLVAFNLPFFENIARCISIHIFFFFLH